MKKNVSLLLTSTDYQFSITERSVSLIHIPNVILSRLWMGAILCILLSTGACQQGKQQPQEKITQQQVQSQQITTQHQPITKENLTMAFFLTQFSYTPETWARLMKNPEDRRVAARKYIESVGGKLHGFWYALGAYNGYCLWEAPDNVSMAAVEIGITGGGALSKFETTPLLTVEETLDALRLAQKIAYQPPGAR